ncbi:ATP synthase D chain [Actinidia rufa]|uniref:ATP synthase D chain n=1 Tax=Actinidia rufa TaxID=165716 RepID=A0A7J0GRB4_9ERIC|nr:ATP synthase D chain [Actinidia rufa]
MSGAGKKVVDVAFKAGKCIDWDGMAKLMVSEEARKEFATLRRAFDEVNTALQTNSTDWTIVCNPFETITGLLPQKPIDLIAVHVEVCPSVEVDAFPKHIRVVHAVEPEPIDWEYYRKGIGSRLVDMYKEAYESIEIPKYVDNVTPQYKPKFEALVVELKVAEENSLKESERLEKEITEVQELKKKISTMTAEEYFEKHPEVKKKFDDEIRNDYWGY